MNRHEKVIFSQALRGVPVRWTDALALALAGLVLFAVSVVFNAGGLIHFEWEQYIAYHLGPGTIWEKIFDSRNLDQGTYAGRELSYLVDHVDVWLVALSVKWGCPLFISTTHVGLSVFMGVWIGWFAARDLRLGSLIGLLLALLLWTAPALYLHYLMRTAKVLTAAALVVLVVEIYRAVVGGSDKPAARLAGRFWFSITTAAFVLSFADRQGFYFLLCACGFMAMQWALDRSRVSGSILGLLAAVLAVEMVYFFRIAPALTRAFFNYDPDFSLNQLPLAELRATPAYFGQRAWELLANTISFTLGRIPHWAVALLLLATVAAALLRDLRRRTWSRRIPLAGTIVVMTAGLWVMYALMILRHPPLLWPDMSLTYYWIPTAALAVLGAVSAWSDWAEPREGRKIALATVLLALVVGNIAALPGHSAVIESGHLRDSIQRSREIRYALMHRGDPRYIIPAEINAIPAYQALLEHAPRRTYPAMAWDEPTLGAFHQATRGPGAPISFMYRFGGNADSRFITTTARFFKLADGREFLGGTAGSVEMRWNLPSNRMRGELVLKRVDPGSGTPLSADFAVYARHYSGVRYERWTGRVELAAGQDETVVPYAIDSSHLPALFTVEIPPRHAGKVVAGWRNPEITDIGGDSSAPAWLVRSREPVVALDEKALAALLSPAWRPVQAQMHRGRRTDAGIELQPGGEIWIQARHIVSRLAGVATAAPGGARGRLAVTKAFWYKAGRLEGYSPPAPPSKTDGAMSFQAWCAEPGGWIVIAADPDPVGAPVLIRINEVRQEEP